VHGRLPLWVTHDRLEWLTSGLGCPVALRSSEDVDLQWHPPPDGVVDLQIVDDDEPLLDVPAGLVARIVLI
jgi:hypothetical protein